jgi:iron complex transport system ATP-binding protein
MVRLNGTPVASLGPAALARELAVVLTDRVTVGLLSVYDLVALGRHPHTDWSGRLRPEDHAAVERAIDAAGAADLAARFVGELSDGERQRVMVARALAQEPSIMILDEITAFLDLPRRVEIMQLLASLAHEHGRTVLISTHDLELALQTADTLWLLADGHLRHGVPERLVLDGGFDAVFDSVRLQFDRRRGSFRLRRAHRGQAVVVGESLEAHWTRHALERQGFEIVPEGAGSAVRRIEVRDDGGRIEWSTRHADGRRDVHDGFESLIDSVRLGPHVGDVPPG